MAVKVTCFGVQERRFKTGTQTVKTIFIVVGIGMKICRRAPDVFWWLSHLSCSGYFGDEKNLLFHGNLSLICESFNLQPNHCTNYAVLAPIVLGFCKLCRWFYGLWRRVTVFYSILKVCLLTWFVFAVMRCY
jgi:hypothetical protein